jgi:hypothetical protein
MQDISVQVMTFAKAMIVVEKLEDSKQRVWPSW